MRFFSLMAGRANEPGLLDASVLRDFPIGRRYLAGISGGRDSVALLHALLASGYNKLVVCHLNHQLRGRSAAADARFVRQLADKHGLAFELGSVDVRARAASDKVSIETAARAARFEFFAQVARRRRCGIIFLGHHADDLVETFLMNLFRGSAATRSMQSIAMHSLGKTTLTVVRPMLAVWRDEIDNYIRDHAFRFREDASNAQLNATRNRMRHKIIPSLEKEFGRGIRKSIWRAATIASEEEALLATMLAPVADKLRVDSLANEPSAIQRRTIRKWLQHHAIADIGFELVESVRALIEPDVSRAKVNLPGNRHARRRAGELFIV